MLKKLEIERVAEDMVNVANQYGIINTISELFGIDDGTSKIRFQIYVPESFAEESAQMYFDDMSLSPILHKIDSPTVSDTVKIVTDKLEGRGHCTNLGKRKMGTLNTIILENAWSRMNDEQKFATCVSILERNTYV